MILKVLRHNDNQRWWMFDNIGKISISHRINKSTLICPPGADRTGYDVELFDIETNCTCKDESDECSKCKFFIVAVCRMDDDKEISIAFDNTAYLLNDSGKTIEKIVANLC